MSSRIVLPALFALCVLVGCSKGSSDNPAQTAIDQAMAAHGGDIIDNSRITFEFRGFQFVLERENGRFQYERSFEDDTGARIREN